MLSDAPDPTLDYLPPRWTWVRRIAATFFSLLVAMFLLRLYAGHTLDKQLAEYERRVRDRGDAWVVEDLNLPTIAPGDPNTAEFYRKAFAAQVPGVEGFRNSVFGATPDIRHADIVYWLAENSAAQNRRMFELAREARSTHATDWGKRLSSANINGVFGISPHLDLSRQLANELADNAVLLHLRGDEIAAIERFRDLLHLSAAVGQERQIVAQLVSVGIVALTLDAMETFAQDARVDQPAVRQSVTTLMSELEDQESRINRGIVTGVTADGAVVRDAIEILRRSTWLTSPVLRRTQLDLTRHCEATRSYMVGEPPRPEDNIKLEADYGAKRIRLLGAQFTLLPPPSPSMRLTQILGSSFGSYVEAGRRARMELRLARVMLATRMYYVDHNAWPASVDALVPKYLPEVPCSPHSPEQFRVEFTVLPKGRPDGADRPMVYVDLYTSVNDPMDRNQLSWTAMSGPLDVGKRADARGRQWRDAAAWPLSAYPKSALTGFDSDPDPTFWMDWENPGNPGALQAPPKHPNEPEEPRDDAEPEEGV